MIDLLTAEQVMELPASRRETHVRELEQKNFELWTEYIDVRIHRELAPLQKQIAELKQQVEELQSRQPERA